MAYENFKPTIWSKFIQHELEKKAILLDSCWRQFDGEVQHTKSVKILGVGKPTIGDYTGASIGDPENVQDTSVTMLIDQAKYFNFHVDDVDKAQSIKGLMEALMKEATLAMALEVDSFIAKQAQYAGAFSTSAAITTSSAALAAIDLGLLYLRENDVQLTDEVVVEIPPFLYQLIKNEIITLDTDNSELLSRGIIGKYDGVKVRVSNNLYNNDTDYFAMIRTPKAIAFAQQIQKVEPYSPEGLFSDAIKGLNVFGAKVVRPKELYAIKCRK